MADFYAGKRLFIFGSTSFPGKVLLEKLLRTCPQLEQIVCPVRTSHHTAEEIFAEIYTTKLFDRVRRINPKFQEKILPIDFHTELDLRPFEEKIDLCFYIADHSIDFEEKNFKELIQRNVIDLGETLQVLKRCRKLTSVCYLSSIYANIGKKSLCIC